MTDYCTLAQAKSEIKANSTVDDAQVRRYIRQVSKRIDSTIGRPKRPFFAPYTEQRLKRANTMRIDSSSNIFYLRDNLLSFSEVLIDTADETANVQLWEPGQSPYGALRLTNDCKTWYGDCTHTNSDTLKPVLIYITGVWGWHEDYANAYADRDILQADINASVTTLTVADADGADEDGFTPRFSPGNLIRIDSELMDVVDVNTDTNVLTVKRGVNGTTAAAHLTGADVAVYLVDDRVVRITQRQVGLLYARQGAFQIETLDGVGAISYPTDLLEELEAVLTDFQYA